MTLDPFGSIALSPTTADRQQVTRRFALAGLGAAAIGLGLPRRVWAQTPQDMVFRVHRGSSPMGWLRTGFSRDGDRLTVRTKLELSVYIAFVRAFRYEHTSEEVFQGNRILSITADTNDDGKQYKVRATPVGTNVRVEGPLETVTAPAATLTTNSVWNPAFVRQQMLIDCEKGRYVPLRVQPLGDKSVTVAKVARVATGYRTTLPYADADLYYDGAGAWVHAVYRTKGETLVYERES
ncbi:MAG TPA: DUF6134 family protein [Vineibacter sp.]|nr:DUF6134 family protein [Vineibacter sp.]